MIETNTICAIATAPGGAIGIIRLSGEEAIAIADRVFRPVGCNASLLERKPYTLAYGNIVDESGDVVDEVLVSVFHAPHSYTGENAVEISCHGSSYILQQVMHLLLKNGCVTAQPGEFTRRAFLNGKMDLSQAEAVADLIGSTNKATHQMAMSQLKGHFSSELDELRAQLLHMTSLLELELDFSDHEELEFADRSQLCALALGIRKRLENLANSFDTGNALKHGIPVAIVGNTNVGKSTLLNRLLHEEKAIVSDVHGTTRDFIEDTTVIGAVTYRFIDTAGIRQTDDVVESIGIERTYKKISEARVILWIVDRVPSQEDMADMRKHSMGKRLVIVRNKIDMPQFSNADFVMDGVFRTVSISAKNGTNMPDLLQAIVDAADIPTVSESDVIVTSVRHYDALLHALDGINRVIEAMNIGLSGDLIAEDLRVAIDSLADITGNGRISSQETLNNIFKHFCIGK